MLILWDFVVLVFLQLKLAEGSLGILNLLFLFLVLTIVEMILLSKPVDFNLALFALNLAFSSLPVGFCLKLLFRLLLLVRVRSALPFLIPVCIIAVVQHIHVLHLVLLLHLNLLLQQVLEALDVFSDQF